MTFTFIYQFFQIHFPIDSLFHSLSPLNIISSFIIYYFFNNYTSSNIFYPTPNYYNRKKRIWRMNNSSSALMSYCSWVKKKIQGIESPLETLFLVSLSIIESILLLATPLKMLLPWIICQIYWTEKHHLKTKNVVFNNYNT